MKAFSILGIILFTSFTCSLAQCDNCVTKSNIKADYCYQHPKFSGQCAVFTDQAESFILLSGKDERSLPLTTKAGFDYFLDLAQNKKYKIDAPTLLFIQEAIKSWEIESKKIGYEMLESGLGIKIISEGSGPYPEQGQVVKVHYSGFLEDGTKFDSSVDRGQPFEFPLGMGRVIKGWDEGVAKLKAGTKAILQIPSHLGYGTRGAGGVIPPNATLYFEIEVLE